jgi:release factor glutamine methyltransferase
MQIHAAWHAASAALKTVINDEVKLEAQLLLEHVLNVNHAWLITHTDAEMDSKAQQQFNALIQRRIAGEPIAYILGEREFYGLTLKVTPDTLIPRPDTETLVEAALGKIPASSFRRKSESSDLTPLASDFRRNDVHEDNALPIYEQNDGEFKNNFSESLAFDVLDLGTGSGAIALAIAAHRPNVNIIAVDFSQAALKIAKQNAENLNINNVVFLQSDWFDALGEQRFDIIVSNPPYIENNDVHLNQGDLRFEPRSALASGNDGLDDIRKIIQHAASYLKPQGLLMFEHGYNQAESVSILLASAHFTAIETHQDLGGNDRVTLGRMI